jgi:hypothetical protein
MPYKPTQFCLTVIKPYYKDNSSKPLQDTIENAPEESHNQYTLEGDHNPNIIIINTPQLWRGRGRPKGLQNHQHLINFEEQFIVTIKSRVELSMAFITAKEKADFKLTKQL